MLLLKRIASGLVIEVFDDPGKVGMEVEVLAKITSVAFETESFRNFDVKCLVINQFHSLKIFFFLS